MSLNPTTLNEAADAIRAAKSVVLSGHVNPDGDALGSVLAISHALWGMGKQATPVSADGVPELIRFLPGAERVVTETAERGFDLAVLCDLEGVKRIGKTAETVLSAKRIVVVDHHQPWEQLGDIRLIDTSAPSTTSLVYRLIQVMGAPITPDVATCLLTGLVTDTGSFRYSNTNPTALRVAADLIEAGADITFINREVYENCSLASLKLQGLALSKMQMSPDQKLVWASLSLADFESVGATDEQSEGIVGLLRSVKGAEVAALFRETKPDRIRISLRSRERVDVAALAQQYGGGGHRLAAGLSLAAPLAEAESQVVAAIKQWMDSSQ